MFLYQKISLQCILKEDSDFFTIVSVLISLNQFFQQQSLKFGLLCLKALKGKHQKKVLLFLLLSVKVKNRGVILIIISLHEVSYNFLILTTFFSYFSCL